MFSAFSLHVKGCIWPQCYDHPTARIILSERKDDRGARMMLPPGGPVCPPTILKPEMALGTSSEKQHAGIFASHSLRSKDSVSSEYPNSEQRVENTTHGGVFLRKFKVSRYPIKHCLECLIYLLNRNKN